MDEEIPISRAADGPKTSGSLCPANIWSTSAAAVISRTFWMNATVTAPFPPWIFSISIAKLRIYATEITAHCIPAGKETEKGGLSSGP
nr:hypothetical protein [Methanolacinia paynteri]